MKCVSLSKLTAKQRNHIEALVDLCCAAEPVRLSIPLPKAGEALTDERFFLLGDHGKPVSLIHLFYPDHTVGELIGFTHPDFRRNGYFKQLLSLAADYAEEIGLEQVYIIRDDNSADADNALATLGLTAEYTEYMLGKTVSHRQSTTEVPLTVEESGPSSVTADLFAEIFQADLAQCEAYLEEISSDERIHTYVLKLAGKHIGQTQLTFMDDMAYISGFGILPEYRRQGYGLMFLNRLEALMAGQSVTRLTLQVSSHNKTALSLYRKDGFETLEALHYHPLFEEE